MLITCNNCGAKVPKERYTYHLKGCKRMSVQNHTSKKPKYGGIQVSQLSAFSFISSANKSLTMPENISHQIRNISGDNNLGFSLDNTEFSVHDEDSSLEEQHNDQEQEEESLEEQIPLLEMQARHLKSLMITNAEHVSLEFYNLLESLGVSKSAYDKIIKFISENNMKDLSNMLCYKSLLSNMEKRSGNDLSLSIAQNLQNNRAKDLKLCTFWTMEDKYRIISVDCISSPTYVMNNFDNTRHIDANDDMRLLKTVIQIKSFSEWKNVYL
jgi:hypothetical protein